MLRVVLLSGAVMLVAASAALAFPPIDLTTSGATYTSADGTIWTQLTSQPTGTGNYDPFVRFQANGTEAGMNTDGNAAQSYDDKAGTWTHSVKLSDLNTVTQNGVDYYSFSLDINETNSDANHLLSLDEMRIYTVGSGAGGALLTEADVTGAGGVKRYDLDGTVDQDVYMDYNLAAGSGHDDIQVLIPTSNFSGASSSDYVYFYNLMGATTGLEGDFTSDDGFEEWHALTGGGGQQLPEPSTVMLLGTGLLGILAVRRRRL